MARKDFSFLDVPKVLIPAKALDKKSPPALPVFMIREKKSKAWLGKRTPQEQANLASQGWTGKAGNFAALYDADGHIAALAFAISDKLGLYDTSSLVDNIRKTLGESPLMRPFTLQASDLKDEEIDNAVCGWVLACYQFDAYKKPSLKNPQLIWPKDANQSRIETVLQSICLIRNLINLPANDLGPDELVQAAEEIGKAFGADTEITTDKDLLTYNFPLIYAVGMGSDRPPALIDMTWGNAKHPKITLVGKGVVFDTGGYNLKPSASMLLMKKDMGGAAMALGLAWQIMARKLPLRLRVIIATVENSVSGHAFRPMDILTSRKGLSVEIGDTDAEGRLILADCLTLAAEEKPDLLVDFATLTGAAHYAVGYHIASVFSNTDSLAEDLKKISMQIDDPVWPMPLWDSYKKDILSPNADLSSTAQGNLAGSITAALFLQNFVPNDVPWIHFDHCAWEYAGRPGRPRGGTDMGMRSVLALLEQNFIKKKK
ncbi:MAG: leucyl aminopeptidase family protein [Alphaproteobacteria bacterium]|nr:leucyl aminopeptidase family protein [Alphaproteobacteria bacterium]